MAAYFLDNLICPANATHTCQQLKKFFIHLQNCKEVKLSRLGMRSQIYQLYQKRQKQCSQENKENQQRYNIFLKSFESREVEKNVRLFIENQQLLTRQLIDQGQQFQNEIKLKQAECDHLDQIIASNEKKKSEKLKEMVLISQNSVLDKKADELICVIESLKKEIAQSQDFLSKNSGNDQDAIVSKEISLSDIEQEFNRIQEKEREEELQKLCMENELLELEKQWTEQKYNFQQLKNQLASSVKSIESYAQIQNYVE